jgi:hypothetical protein
MFLILLLFVIVIFFVSGNIAYLFLNDGDPNETDPFKKKYKILLVALWFPLMACWFTFTYMAYNNSRADLHEAELKFKFQEMEWLEAENNQNVNIANNLNEAFLDIKSFREAEEVLCKSNSYMRNEQNFLAKQQQLIAKLEHLGLSVKQYFGEEVYKKLQEYLDVINTHSIPCIKNFPATQDLVAIQNEINEMMAEKNNVNLEKIEVLKESTE